jgi:hypothetical protein
MVPSLFSHIPGDGEALQATAGKGDEILLEREPAEGEETSKSPIFPSCALSVHENSPYLLAKTGSDPVGLKNRVIEISLDCFSSHGHIHGMVMVGVQPFVIFFLVALPCTCRLPTNVAGRSVSALPYPEGNCLLDGA